MDEVIAGSRPIPLGPDDADCCDLDLYPDVQENSEEESVPDAVPEPVPVGK